MQRISALLVILALISAPSFAAKVYKYTDESGNTVFTDEPTSGAEELDVKPVPTIPAIPVPKAAPAPAATSDFKYNKITIVTPTNEEYFINNQGAVTVQVAVSPNLRRDDKVQLYFNGSPRGGAQKSTSFSFQNLDRGEYATHATIVDKNGKEVGKSNTITFFIKRSTAPRPTPARSN